MAIEQLAEMMSRQTRGLCSSADVAAVLVVERGQIAALEAVDPVLLRLLEGEVGVDDLEGPGRLVSEDEGQLFEASARSGEHQTTVERVAKLAYVSRPSARLEQREVVAGDRTWIEASTLVEVSDQRGQIF